MAALVTAGVVAQFPLAALATLPDPEWRPSLLLTYDVSDEATLTPKRVDQISLSRQGRVELLRSSKGRFTVRSLCLSDYRRRKIERLLADASNVAGGPTTQPYPVEGRQLLTFGRGGRHDVVTLPGEAYPPMQDRTVRELFRKLESIRADVARERPHRVKFASASNTGCK